MKETASLWAIALLFSSLSLVAVGGANVVVPEMHRQAVDIGHWMTDTEFASLYAIVRAAPGPNMLISTLIGWKAAGLAGAPHIGWLTAQGGFVAGQCRRVFNGHQW